MAREGGALRRQGDILPQVGGGLGVGVKPRDIYLYLRDIHAALIGGGLLYHRGGIAAAGDALLHRLTELLHRELDRVLHG